MSTRLRSRMPAFALRASVVAMAALASVLFCVVATIGPGPAAAAPRTSPDTEERLRERPDPETPGERAARIAVKAVGVPYRWGGESPETGFDCSGLVRWAYGRIGVELPHNSYALYQVGRSVPRNRMEPGDVLFFEGLGHVGLYLGRGRMVHAPQTGRDVEIVRLGATNYGSRLIGARRMAA
jgi:cell wall-associated NlpC family hydrolase